MKTKDGPVNGNGSNDTGDGKESQLDLSKILMIIVVIIIIVVVLVLLLMRR